MEEPEFDPFSPAGTVERFGDLSRTRSSSVGQDGGVVRSHPVLRRSCSVLPSPVPGSSPLGLFVGRRKKVTDPVASIDIAR